MFYMVENIVTDQKHSDVLKISLAANTHSLVCLSLMVHIINSGPFDSGILGFLLFGLFLFFSVGYKCS